jgi:hypothetical protein
MFDMILHLHNQLKEQQQNKEPQMTRCNKTKSKVL